MTTAAHPSGRAIAERVARGYPLAFQGIHAVTMWHGELSLVSSGVASCPFHCPASGGYGAGRGGGMPRMKNQPDCPYSH